MRILVVTNIYPTAKRPFMSPFVKEQVDSLRDCFPELTIDVRVVRGRRPRAEYLKEMLRLPAVVRKGRYDLLHAHFGLTLVSTLLVRTPVVVTFHGSDLLVNPTRHISRLLAPTASRVIVVAPQLREVLGYGEVIPCGIDTTRFALPASRRHSPTPKIPGPLKVLFPAAPSNPIKNHTLFQAACRELERKGNRIEEVLLDNIHRDRVPNVYWHCDLMLLTSLSEGSPTVIKEAIASKLPFVSVDVGDVRDWAARVAFGEVVREKTPEAIASAATDLLSRTGPRAPLDNTTCTEAMDIHQTSRRLKCIYDQVVEREFKRTGCRRPSNSRAH